MKLLGYGQVNFEDTDQTRNALGSLNRFVAPGESLICVTDASSAILVHRWATKRGVEFTAIDENEQSLPTILLDIIDNGTIERVIVFSQDRRSKFIQRAALKHRISILIVGPWPTGKELANA